MPKSSAFHKRFSLEICSNEMFSTGRWSVSRSTRIGDIPRRIPTRSASFFSLPFLGHLPEARLNEAASRQTLSRVRWRQCV